MQQQELEAIVQSVLYTLSHAGSFIVCLRDWLSTTDSHRRVKVSPVFSAVCCITQESYINQISRVISRLSRQH